MQIFDLIDNLIRKFDFRGFILVGPAYIDSATVTAFCDKRQGTGDKRQEKRRPGEATANA